jgi:large subunit ribosomal protein L17
MRHLKAGRKLNRNASHRLALMRNLSLALFRSKNGRFIEKLITLAKQGDLHARRLALARLGPCAHALAKADEDDTETRTILTKLFEDFGPRFKDRPGGYTRIIKRHERRLGDAGQTAILELLKEGEVKVQRRAPAPPSAPAPRVTQPEPETPAQPPAL